VEHLFYCLSLLLMFFSSRRRSVDSKVEISVFILVFVVGV